MGCLKLTYEKSSPLKVVYFSENEENRSKSVLWNNPIRYTDPDGRFPIDIHVRSFAPFAHFGNFLPFNGLGGLWHGDNRSFSTSLSASSRIRQVTNYETDTRESFTQAFGNISASSYGAFAYSEAGLKDYSRGNNINTHLSGNNDAFSLLSRQELYHLMEDQLGLLT